MISNPPRERLVFDQGWRFALGHAFDPAQDFQLDSSHFSFLAKAGYGDGAASPKFDDRAWRVVDLPHDWCVELPFDQYASHSHGYKAIGRKFPANSVGWYRKSFEIAASELGRRISLEFDGVHRDSKVWINGFYLGNEPSGYTSFSYDISDYLNYGGQNVVVVRADATTEEGWFYEGAGIYRHVWLCKTAPLHVARYGTFVTSEVHETSATITIQTTIVNQSQQPVEFSLRETINAPDATPVVQAQSPIYQLAAGQSAEFTHQHQLNNPQLWDLTSPHLYQLTTTVQLGDDVVDSYETSFGVRSIRFDPDQGFFLNGRSVKLVGSNQHQDHAGVGTALPDSLQTYRIQRLQEFNHNAIRTSHNPPTPEFLDACDRLGMLVLNENRLMGSNPEHLRHVEQLIKRDRNHPSVILWSLGNEEWAIEGTIIGARIASTMQRFARQFDHTRLFTIACSGGWDKGIGTVTDVVGYNYIWHGDIDAHHAKFPWQAGVGTEESNTYGTRGIYQTDASRGHLAASPSGDGYADTEFSWQFYAQRPFLAGLFFWTGFDYRGEPTPFEWPAVASQFGFFDLCGFPKDIAYYTKAWWGQKPVLHLGYHWDWPNDLGQVKSFPIYSNCQEVELWLNGVSLGRRAMPKNGHQQWEVAYQPGELLARGYNDGVEVISASLRTSQAASQIQLVLDYGQLKQVGDLAVVTLQVCDEQGQIVPTANHLLDLQLTGSAKILGVGNGDPSSHESDQYHQRYLISPIQITGEQTAADLSAGLELARGAVAQSWQPAFWHHNDDQQANSQPYIVFNGSFELPNYSEASSIRLFSKSIAHDYSVYINGQLIASEIALAQGDQVFELSHDLVRPGQNSYLVTGRWIKKANPWTFPNREPGVVQVIEPAAPWQRRAFNGLAQVIVQHTGGTEPISLSANNPELSSASLTF
ncbi:beta-galactosidase GalA [Herpetosiphon geysericola]|uniref:Beta-galactosidase n=1 Tax=Herpetosiphon geysericola TaxID=70996 RepID=A0A0P6Y5X6_9CHLR|nr:beta-galactosidase GalA [Herpetosiphon geysericola]KPL88123.1 beta-galactosidase [Herpetosiphon geysericola]